MKIIKLIGTALLAIMAAVVVWNILAAVIGLVFKVTFFLIKILIIGVIALPFYIYLRNKLFSSK